MDGPPLTPRIASALIVAVMVSGIGCQPLVAPSGPTFPPSATGSVRPSTSPGTPTERVESATVGVVLSVVGTSPTEVTGFTLRLADGERMTFQIGALDLQGGFDANHLREHQATGDPVRVDYITDVDRRLAIRLNDVL